MKIRVSLVAAALVMGKMAFAQSVDEGKRFLYHQRYQSAKETFGKVIASKPNPEATYWLGQADLGLKDSAAALNVYQKALQAGGTNEPWLLVGIGQLELMQNKTADARNRFETAISLSKAKDPAILTAVGRANIDARYGDANYAIEKLNMAIEKSTKKGPDAAVYIALGDAYAKLIDGGNAVTNYQKALDADPKSAEAKYKIGLVYKTQNNAQQYVPDFESAIALDPDYAPAYYQLYSHYYTRDITKAKEYSQKYIAVSDQSDANKIMDVEIEYAAQQYQQAIAKADQLLASVSDKYKSHLYRLKAYSYAELGDYTNAKASIDQFLAKPSDDAVGKNYEMAAKIYSKVPGGTAQAFDLYSKAIAIDTLVANKGNYTKEAAALADSLQDKKQSAYWLGQSFVVKGETANNLDLYNWGTALFNANEFATADSVFAVYTQKYPEQVYGFYWRARANWSLDSTFEKGLAVPHFEKMIEVIHASKDSATYVEQEKAAYSYFIQYYVKKKDYKNAFESCNKFLALDPANDQIKKYRDILEKYVKGGTPAGAKPAAGAKTT